VKKDLTFSAGFDTIVVENKTFQKEENDEKQSNQYRVKKSSSQIDGYREHSRRA
jgi:hypothetical protein